MTRRVRSRLRPLNASISLGVMACFAPSAQQFQISHQRYPLSAHRFFLSAQSTNGKSQIVVGGRRRDRERECVGDIDAQRNCLRAQYIREAAHHLLLSAQDRPELSDQRWQP